VRDRRRRPEDDGVYEATVAETGQHAAGGRF